jgi:uncharacterized protein with von Willebrand factor type A (vWA) domain
LITRDPIHPGEGSAAVQGAFLANLVGFVRLLRRAGVRLGPGATLRTLEAVEAVGVARRDDFFWALHAVLVTRRDEHEVFSRAFEVFWRDPTRSLPELAELLPQVERPAEERPERPAERRVAEASAPRAKYPRGKRSVAHESVDVFLSWSDQERLKTRDFEQMSVEEMDVARRAIASMSLRLTELRTRRWRAHAHGRRIDLRRTIRASARSGAGSIALARTRQRRRLPDVVLLCDISGSMERYARMLLHFAHALTTARGHVHTFLFGTRLTNVTRELRQRDVDRALDEAGKAAPDWSGGTRIGASLERFNRLWSRRVLSRGAIVLLITDGLDREGGEGIAKEAARLGRSCRRLIWLNPLLRYEGFEPKAAGIRALLGQVDEFRPVHDLESLADLADALAGA